MYWPWSFRLARRAGESLSLRSRRPGLAGPRVAASSAGAKRANARMIAASDLRIASTSLPTELARAFGKRASIADVTGRMVLRWPRSAREGAGSPYRIVAWHPRGTPRRQAW